MIKRVNDINILSGVSSPLFPLVYCDCNCAFKSGDGVFVQLSDDEEITALISLRNSTLTVIKITDNTDIAEIEEYIQFFGITSVISDFPINGTEYKRVQLMCCNSVKASDNTTRTLNVFSNLQEYKEIFNLLCGDGEFSEWYPAFSGKVNKGLAVAVYKKSGDTVVSTAVCTAVFEQRAIISGVFTKPMSRGKGYGRECIHNLISRLSEKRVSEIYLWCEDKNIKFYKNNGFDLCGEIYVREDF